MHQSAYLYIDNYFLLSHMKAKKSTRLFCLAYEKLHGHFVNLGIYKEKTNSSTLSCFYSIISRFPPFRAQVLGECVTVHNGIHPNHTQHRKALSFTITHFSHGPHNNSYREKNWGYSEQ